MRLFPILRWLMLSVVLLAVSPAHAQPNPLQQLGNFTTQQRQEIIAIIRDALRTDPSLLRDAITALQEEEERQREGGGAARAGSHGGLWFRGAKKKAGARLVPRLCACWRGQSTRTL